MKCARLYEIGHPASHLEGWIELEQGFRPKLAFRQFPVNLFADLGIRDVQEATDVGRVIADDPGVGIEDVHCKSLLAQGWLFLLSREVMSCPFFGVAERDDAIKTSVVGGALRQG